MTDHLIFPEQYNAIDPANEKNDLNYKGIARRLADDVRHEQGCAVCAYDGCAKCSQCEANIHLAEARAAGVIE